MPTYIIGHKNPDTDAICSALAYADLLRQTSIPDAVAARCGEIPVRTAYALQKAGAPSPQLILDVRPTAGQAGCHHPVFATTEDSIMESFERMRGKGMSSIPVIGLDQKVEGMLSLAKAVNLLLPSADNKKTARVLYSSLARIQKGLGGEFQSSFDIDSDSLFTLMVGALSDEQFTARLGRYLPENLVVVAGDRASIQRAAIDFGVRALILTGENRLSDELQALAQTRRTTVIISPYDTATTTLLVKCSKRISDAIDREFLSFTSQTPIEKVLAEIGESEQTVFPIVDDQSRLIGTLAKSELIDTPRTKVVLVDHNEFSQAVSGVEQAEIVEVIDHHRLGGVTSKSPIRFINEPVGSTCTIIAQLYQRAGLEPSRTVAILLMSGMISDTLNLTSPTTTEVDRQILPWLTKISGLNLETYVEEFFAAGSLLRTATPRQVVEADWKEFKEGDWKFAAAQVEEQSLDDFWKHQEKLQSTLEELCHEKSLDFACLLVTDITRHFSLLVTAGNPTLIANIGYPKMQDHLFELKGVVSRKKQLLPHLTNVISQVKKSA